MKELKDLVAGDKVVAYDKYDNRRIAVVEQHTCWMVKEYKFKSKLKAEKHIKDHFLVEDKQ